MKKTIIAGLAASLVLVMVSCQAAPPPAQQPVVSGMMPAAVQQWLQNPPEDAIFAVGVAKFRTTHQSNTMSQNRARVGIAQTMDSVVQAMVRDYFGAEELTGDSLNFAESISVTLTQADVSGARIAVMDMMPDGTVWSVAVLDRAAMQTIVNHAETMARLAVPAAASFDAQARMDAAFAQRNAGQPVQTVDVDN
ncbi:MAG: hypothetical protein FWG66_13330 [Spirochaetes bacterium]|nr:hypothetical protein [Spirochaetota bacterium]